MVTLCQRETPLGQQRDVATDQRKLKDAYEGLLEHKIQSVSRRGPGSCTEYSEPVPRYFDMRLRIYCL